MNQPTLYALERDGMTLESVPMGGGGEGGDGLPGEPWPGPPEPPSPDGGPR